MFIWDGERGGTTNIYKNYEDVSATYLLTNAEQKGGLNGYNEML